MARLVIRAVTNSGDPSRVYQAGDPVSVFEDGQDLGRLVNLAGGFYVLDYPHVPASAGLPYVRPLYSAVTQEPNTLMLKRRKYTIDLTGIAFDADGFATVTPGDIVSRMVKKKS